MKQRTIEQLQVLYQRVYNRMTAAMGYQAFGYDWPTLRIIRPVTYRVLKRILELEKEVHIDRIAAVRQQG